LRLQNLLIGTSVTAVYADPETEIGGISYDSRITKPGDLFVAVAGEKQDGSRFIPQALENGAVCVVCQSALPEEIPCVVVPDCRRALAELSAAFFENPGKELTLVGVTGTNGKTTTTHLIKRILEQKAGAKVGLIGTIHNVIDQETLPTERTTPESYEIQRLLRQMVDAGCSHVVMEVSSHALMLERVRGLQFAVALFTNLTQDHLDFHGTMENYCAAKAKLFQNCDLAVYNQDDPWSEKLLEGCTCRRVSYGVQKEAELQAMQVSLHSDHVNYVLRGEKSVPVRVAIPGIFTVYNSLAAIAACWNLGVATDDCASVLQYDSGAKGRMEVVPTPGKPYTVLIDYAHTPDALENVLSAVRGFAKGRTVAVFGCGGDRDRTKRPQMGAIAARLADFAVVTTDNPRTEKPVRIIEDILEGMQDTATPYTVVEDRTEAIRWAMEHAQKDDVIVLCGKGHEDYQEIGHQKYHLDEREIVASVLTQKC